MFLVNNCTSKFRELIQSKKLHLLVRLLRCVYCRYNGFIGIYLTVYLQNGAFAAQEGDALSFDECMQLLAETFPLDEPAEVIIGYIYITHITPHGNTTPIHVSALQSNCLSSLWSVQSAPPCLDVSVPPTTDLMMPADIPAFTQNPLLPGSLDQAWMELLSLPELQV